MSNPPASGPSIGPVTSVSFTAPDLDALARAYRQFLGYRVLGEQRIGTGQARAWDAPAVAGRRSLIMASEAGDDCVFRVIEAEPDPDYRPFASYGWNAAELIVQDVDSLARRLEDSPFSIVGEPQDLSFSSDIRAMQILGPGGELLYLTQFKRDVPGLAVPAARCPVDRVFIVILGGPSMASMQDFYADRFGVARAPVVESRVKGMSAAFGLPPEAHHPIAALALAGKCLIEVDEMPAQAQPRPARQGELPPGISIVGFASHPAAQAADRPCLRGPAGERLELVPR